MANQRISITKIGGSLGAHLFEAFRKYGHLRKLTNTERKESVLAVIQSIRDHASSPPILFHMEYIDPWLMGDELAFPKEIEFFSFVIDYTEISGHLLGRKSKLKRILEERKESLINNAQFEESLWFVNSLHAACTAWELLIEDSLLLLVRECFGASLSDNEVVASLKNTPEWLPRL